MARKPLGLRELATGVRVSGKVAEVYRHGNRVGVLWDWTFEGGAGGFRVEAERYRFDASMWGDDNRNAVRIRLLIGETGEVSCDGSVWTPFEADGKSHAAVVVKGDQARWRNAPAVPGASEQRAQTARHTSPATNSLSG